MNYFEGKEERIKQAHKHTNEMNETYYDEILECARNTKHYSGSVSSHRECVQEQQVILTDEDSVSAVFNHQEGRVCVLNFASYKNPGGMFLNGSKAQEECLCHESYLYNVLAQFENSYYEPNKHRLNRAMYTNQALYSPSVRFIRDGKSCFADVLTCAAPNFTTARRYQRVSKEENLSILKDRVKFVMDIASNEKVDTLILGAWGCGVFGQNPDEVASCFAEELKNHPDIRNIVFAVIDKNSKNYNAFAKYFQRA